jgi:hypothetical protein
MQKNRSAAVWLLRQHVHVRHEYFIPLRGELETMDLIRIIEAFQLGAVILVFLSIGAWQNGYCTYQTDEDKT